MKMTNVKNAVAIGVLGVGLTSLAPLARDTTFGGPISIQPKTPVVSIDATQSATNIKTVHTCIIAKKELLTNLERKSEIAKVDKLLQNAKPKNIAEVDELLQNMKPKDIEKLVQDIKTRGSSDRFNRFLIFLIGMCTAYNSFIISKLLRRQHKNQLDG